MALSLRASSLEPQASSIGSTQPYSDSDYRAWDGSRQRFSSLRWAQTTIFELGTASGNDFRAWDGPRRRFSSLGRSRTAIFELGRAQTKIFKLGTASDSVTAVFKLGLGSDNDFQAWDGLRQRFSSLGRPQTASRQSSSSGQPRTWPHGLGQGHSNY